VFVDTFCVFFFFFRKKIIKKMSLNFAKKIHKFLMAANGGFACIMCSVPEIVNDPAPHEDDTPFVPGARLADSPSPTKPQRGGSTWKDLNQQSAVLIHMDKFHSVVMVGADLQFVAQKNIDPDQQNVRCRVYQRAVAWHARERVKAVPDIGVACKKAFDS
jgi:hypothetical protein